MGQRLLHRRLTHASLRVNELREELRIIGDQRSQVESETQDLSIRALVSETPLSEYEYRDAKKHSDVLIRRHGEILREISDLEQKINDLLDRLKGDFS